MTSLRFQTLLFAAIRIIVNTMHRMVYPFLPTFSRSLGVDIAALSQALANRSLAGGLGPIFATVADRHGRKIGLLLGMALFIGGVAVVIVWPSYPGFVILLILAALSKSCFDPSMQAYLGDRIPYQRRGRALAVTELGWSLSFIIGIPLMSVLISRWGWQSPFLALGLLGIVSVAALIWAIPGDSDPAAEKPKVWQNFRRVFSYPPALAGLGVGLLSTVANETVNLVFGVWLEDAFGLKILALGGTAAVIGVAELGGETLVGTLVDRLGKVRAVSIGLITNCVVSAFFPLVGDNLIAAVVVLFLFYITFEFTLVSSIPMMTEILPSARATMMAFNVTVLSLGRAVGALVAPSLFAWGIGASAGATILFNLFAVLMLRAVRKAIPTTM
jgi:predicted MFS family arabinose efflux permease